jgi:hypothetical protein
METGQVFVNTLRSFDNISVVSSNSNRTGSNQNENSNENVSRDSNAWQGYHVHLANIFEINNLIY